MRPSRVAFTACLLLVALPALPLPLMAQWDSDPWLAEPVDAATFESWQPFFSYDDELPFDLEVRSVVNEEGIRVESLQFTSTPGEVVYADYYTAPAPGDRPHLVLLPGGSAAGKATLRGWAKFLVRRGFGVIAIDLPYFGERDTGLLGSFSEREKHVALYNRGPTYLQWVIQVVKDVGRTLDLLRHHYDVDLERTGFAGRSRGAQVGFMVLAVEERLRAGALLYGGHFDRYETGHLAAACPANYIGRIAPRPLWLLNGIFDGDYDQEKSVEPLHRHAGEPTEVRWVETGHTLAREEDLERMAEWLHSVLDE